MFFGKYMDQAESHKLSKLTKLNIHVKYVNKHNTPPPYSFQSRVYINFRILPNFLDLTPKFSLRAGVGDEAKKNGRAKGVWERGRLS